jgi:hypothetical protein
MTADPAPLVDRHERALAQGIDDLAQAEDTSDEVGPFESIGREPAQRRLDAEGRASAHLDDDSVVTVAGLGAFPLQVTTGPGGVVRQDPVALLETLPDVPLQDERAVVVAAVAGSTFDEPVPLVMYPPPITSERQGPDYLTAAFGLTLGLGLMSRPLLTDLLARVRFCRRPWRWQRGGLLRRGKPRSSGTVGTN